MLTQVGYKCQIFFHDRASLGAVRSRVAQLLPFTRYRALKGQDIEIERQGKTVKGTSNTTHGTRPQSRTLTRLDLHETAKKVDDKTHTKTICFSLSRAAALLDISSADLKALAGIPRSQGTTWLQRGVIGDLGGTLLLSKHY